MDHLRAWIVQDGEIPELAVGDRLRNVGVRFNCDRITTASGSDAEAISVPTPRDQYRHTLTGVITRATGGVFSATVLHSAAGYFFLEPADPPFDSVAAGTSVEIDPHRIPQVPAGTVVSGTADIMTLIPIAGSRDSWRPGEVIGVQKIDRMRRWHDDASSARRHATYLLRLEIPPNATANPSQ